MTAELTRGVPVQLSKEHARTLYAAFLDLLFPPRCVYCRKTGCRLCAGCAGEIPWIDSSYCPVCGLPRGKDRHHRCIENRRLRFIRSAAEFSGAMRKALHALKYTSDRPLAEELVRLSYPHWSMPTWAFDCLIPVPLGQERERSRGYNQAGLLADALSRTTRIPLAAGSLRRMRETPSQVGLSCDERNQNMKDAFHAASVADCKVLLVDDVCTTGATLLSCAAALTEAGAELVCAVTLARAPAPDDRRDS